MLRYTLDTTRQTEPCGGVRRFGVSRIRVAPVEPDACAEMDVRRADVLGRRSVGWQKKVSSI